MATTKRFRTWHDKTKRYISAQAFQFRDENGVWEIKAPSYLQVEQSTGLKDKHGVEIFEGDVIKAKFMYNYGDGNGINEYWVKFEDNGFLMLPIGVESWRNKGANTLHIGNMTRLEDYDIFEVIGNIHEPHTGTSVKEELISTEKVFFVTKAGWEGTGKRMIFTTYSRFDADDIEFTPSPLGIFMENEVLKFTPLDL